MDRGPHRPRILLACQPAAETMLSDMLGDLAELVPVHTMAEALASLETTPERFDLILSTLTFSESRMLEFLVAVKANPALRGIPFLCCRAIVGILSEQLVNSLGNAARLCGAAAFVDLGGRPAPQARDALRAAVASCLAASKSKET